MLARRLDRRRHRADDDGVLAGSGDDILQRHASGGHRACLVEDDSVDAAGVLEHFGATDQDAELSTASGADEQRGRRSKAKRAWASDDQHRHGCCERRLDITGRNDPRNERDQRDDDDDRHEDAGDPIREPLHRRLAPLRLGDEAGHVRELRVCSYAGGSHGQGAIDVDGGTRHGIAGTHLEGHRLPGKQRCVDGALARLDDSVGGNALARADDEAVAHAQGGRGRADLHSFHQHGRVGRGKAGERPQGSSRAALGARFKPAPRKQEHRHRGRHLEVEVGWPIVRAREEPMTHRVVERAGTTEDQCPHAP